MGNQQNPFMKEKEELAGKLLQYVTSNLGAGRADDLKKHITFVMAAAANFHANDTHNVMTDQTGGEAYAQILELLDLLEVLGRAADDSLQLEKGGET